MSRYLVRRTGMEKYDRKRMKRVLTLSKAVERDLM